MGRLPEAWVASHQVRELRELTRYRVKLVRIRTSCKDQVYAILAKLGVPVTCTGIFGVWGSTWLDGLELQQPYAGKMASLRKICAVLTDEITLLETVIAGLLNDDQRYQAIRALPGVGPVLGAVIVAEIGDITRFPRPAELCSWAGLTPRHRESDTKVSRGHIMTRQGRFGVIPRSILLPVQTPAEKVGSMVTARLVRYSTAVTSEVYFSVDLPVSRRRPG